VRPLVLVVLMVVSVTVPVVVSVVVSVAVLMRGVVVAVRVVRTSVRVGRENSVAVSDTRRRVRAAPLRCDGGTVGATRAVLLNEVAV